MFDGLFGVVVGGGDRDVCSERDFDLNPSFDGVWCGWEFESDVAEALKDCVIDGFVVESEAFGKGSNAWIGGEQAYDNFGLIGFDWAFPDGKFSVWGDDIAHSHQW